MKVGIVMSSELTKHNRWDAGFHLLNQQYKDKAAKLEKTMSAEEAIALLSDEAVFPTAFLRVLEPLCRGNLPPNGFRAHLLKAIREYPFLSLAVVSDKAQDVIRAQQADLQRRADALAKVSAKLESVQHQVQSMVQAVEDSIVDADEPDLGNNEETDRAPIEDRQVPGLESIPEHIQAMLSTHRFVTGVVYRDGDELIIPVHTSETMWLVDCWVIDIYAWKGLETLAELTGDGNVPVPRRHEDLGHPIGYLSGLPDHEVNYGLGWRG